MASIELPVPTDRTSGGPEFHSNIRQVIVKYDYEQDDGRVIWAQLVFDDVLAFEYRDGFSCREGDGDSGFHHVRVLRNSEYLDNVVGRWKAMCGGNPRRFGWGSPERFRHFTVSFDDDGSVNVIAATIEIGDVRTPEARFEG